MLRQAQSTPGEPTGNDRFAPLVGLAAAFLAVFLFRAVLAASRAMPATFHLFDTLTVAGALLVWLHGYGELRRRDWIMALSLALVVGAGMFFATLFSPYPFWGIVRSDVGQALLRAGFTAIAALGGLVIMRRGGPVPFHLAQADGRSARRGLLWGLAVGLPLALLNVVALQLTQGQSIVWQNPPAALLDALQPALVEEIVYRFALWGLLWLLLRGSLPGRAPLLSGLLAMLVHNFSHFDELFLQSPLAALGMGALLAVFWGLPPLVLARRRGLEAAIAFHWIQDVARFLAGF